MRIAPSSTPPSLRAAGQDGAEVALSLAVRGLACLLGVAFVLVAVTFVAAAACAAIDRRLA